MSNLDRPDSSVEEWARLRGVDLDGASEQFGLAWSPGSVRFPVYSMTGKGLFQIERRTDGREPRYSVHPSGARKSMVLYGLNWLLPRLIRQEVDYVVVVEGTADCLALQQAGVPAVASLTAALSRTQLAILESLDVDVVWWADGDDPGSEALKHLPTSWKALQVAQEDPASTVAKLGVQRVLRLLADVREGEGVRYMLSGRGLEAWA